MNSTIINASKTHYLRPCSWSKHNESRNRSSLAPEGPAQSMVCPEARVLSSGDLSRTHEQHSLAPGTDAHRSPPPASVWVAPPQRPAVAHGSPRRPHDPLRDMPTFRVPPLEPSPPLSGGGRRPRPLAEPRSPRVGEGSRGRRDAGPASVAPGGCSPHMGPCSHVRWAELRLTHTQRPTVGLAAGPPPEEPGAGAAPGHSRGIAGAQQSGPKPCPARPHSRLHALVSHVPLGQQRDPVWGVRATGPPPYFASLLEAPRQGSKPHTTCRLRVLEDRLPPGREGCGAH